MMQIVDPLTAAKICIIFKTYGAIFLTIVFALAALIIPKQRVFNRLEILFNNLARKRKESVLIVGLITFLSTAIVSYFFYWPIPTIQDEFSYLLAADTFSQGRLTNPAHPMWVHFETIHILHQPTYASKYPPGQGLILALGQVLTGYPIFGLWLSIALACALTCWMLQAWLPPRWALLGSLLMMLRLALFSYWGQSYWGGAVALIGGALVFGSLKRLVKKPKLKLSIVLSLGLGILAITRPYEGAVVGFVAILFLFIELRKKQFSKELLTREIILPSTILLFVIGLWMAYYNWRITGDIFYFPYRAYEAAYGNIPNFLWAKPLPNTVYNHEDIKQVFQVQYMAIYEDQLGSLNRYLVWCWFKLSRQWKFFIDWVFTLPLFALPFLLKNRWVRFASITILVLVIAMMVVAFNFGHYSAPIICLLYFLILQCMRRIYIFRFKKKLVGQFITWAIPTYCISIIILPIVLSSDPFYYVNPSMWESNGRTLPNFWSARRVKLISELNKLEGKHLVILYYQPGHNTNNEWVYNEANIDESKIVWARNMTPERNCELIKYFYDRQAWLLEIDAVTEDYKISPLQPCK